jgi:hypothetical protein
MMAMQICEKWQKMAFDFKFKCGDFYHCNDHPNAPEVVLNHEPKEQCNANQEEDCGNYIVQLFLFKIYGIY